MAYANYEPIIGTILNMTRANDVAPNGKRNCKFYDRTGDACD